MAKGRVRPGARADFFVGGGVDGWVGETSGGGVNTNSEGGGGRKGGRRRQVSEEMVMTRAGACVDWFLKTMPALEATSEEEAKAAEALLQIGRELVKKDPAAALNFYGLGADESAWDVDRLAGRLLTWCWTIHLEAEAERCRGRRDES